ncbi:MAG: hypothetical protein ACOVQ2_01950 [Flavobacterium sp.]
MTKYVTVEQAILKARKYVILPLSIFVFVSFLLLIIYNKYYNNGWIVFIGFVLIVFIYIFWQKHATIKWQFWAFENVRNVHELKKVAIQNEILKPNNSIFDQTEKFNLKHKDKLEEIKAKFELEDEIYEDININFETKIFYNKTKMFLYFIFYLFVFVTLSILSIKEKLTIILFISSGFLTISLFYLSKYYNNKPRICINNNGMCTFKTPFYEWNEIKNEEVITDRHGTNVYYYLIYNHPKGKEKLNIGNFNVNNRKLNNLLIIYRGRNNKSYNL